MKIDTSIEYTHFQYIPENFCGVSLMDFYTLDLLKRVLSYLKHAMNDGLRKIVEGKINTTANFMKSFTITEKQSCRFVVHKQCCQIGH